MDNTRFYDERRTAPQACSLAMVYCADQRLKQIWEPAQAIRNGTLYPELYKPMNEKNMQIDCPEPSAKQAMSFSAWELRLYLDTHPDDMQALELYKRYCAAMECPSYACTFTPEGWNADCEDNRSGWSWINNPWPWELKDNEQTEVIGNVCL